MFRFQIPRIHWTRASRSKLVAVLSVAVSLALVVYFSAKDNQADFLVFRSAAATIANGGNPYPNIHSPRVYSGSAFVYPYFMGVLFIPFTWISRSWAEFSYVLVSTCAYWAGFRLLGIRRLVVNFSLLFSSVVLISIQMGTVNPLLFLALAAVWRLRKNALLAGVILGVAVSAKLFLLPLLLYALLSKRFRLFVASCVSAAGLLVVGWLAGPVGVFRYISMVKLLAAHEGHSGFSLASVLYLAGVRGGDAQITAWVVAMAVLGVGAWTVLRYRRPTEGAILALLICISLMVTPILWSSYLPLLIIAVALSGIDQWALVGFGPVSWILVTADRAGLIGDTIGVLIVLTCCFYYLLGAIRSADDLPKPTELVGRVVVAASRLNLLIWFPIPIYSALLALVVARKFSGIVAGLVQTLVMVVATVVVSRLYSGTRRPVVER